MARRAPPPEDVLPPQKGSSLQDGSSLPKDQQHMSEKVSKALGSPLLNATGSPSWEAPPGTFRMGSNPASPTGLKAVDDTFMYKSHIRRITSGDADSLFVMGSDSTRFNSAPVLRSAGDSVGALGAWTNLFVHFGAEESEQVIDASHDERRPLVRKDVALAPRTSNRAALFILVKSFLGTGELFMPKAFAEGGLAFSVACVLLLGAATCYGILCMVQCRRQLGDVSYAEVGGWAFGPTMRWVVHLSLVLDLVAGIITYIIFVSQNALTAFQAFSDCAPWSQAVTPSQLALAQVALHIPLCLVRDIKYFAVPSLCAEVFMLLGLGYVFFWDWSAAAGEGFQHMVAFNPKSFGISIGIIVFAYDGIALALPLEESMQHRDAYPRLLCTAMALCTTLYVAFGCANYAVLGDKLVDVVFLSLPQTLFIASVEYLYSMAVFFTVPLLFFPLAHLLEADLHRILGHRASSRAFVVVSRSAFILLLGVVASQSSSHLAAFVAMAAAFSALPLTYIYPALFHLRLTRGSALSRLLDALIVAVGLCCTAYVGTHAISSWLHPSATSFVPLCERRGLR